MSERGPTVHRREAAQGGPPLVLVVLVLTLAFFAIWAGTRWDDLGPAIAARLDRGRAGLSSWIHGSGDVAAVDRDTLIESYFRAIDRNDAEEADRLAQAYVRSAPDDAYGYVMRGYVDWWVGRCRDAIEDMDQALTFDRDYGYAYYVRAACRFATGDLTLAARDAKSAVSRALDQNGMLQAYVLQVWLAYAQGHYDEARAAFEAARDNGGDDLPLAAYWLSHLRAGVPYRGDLSSPDGTSWQAGLALDVYAGRSALSDLEEAAARDGLAAFYLAQFALLEGRDADATELLRSFVRDGFSSAPEYAVARVQLKQP